MSDPIFQNPAVIAARTPRVSSQASASSITPDSDNYDEYVQSAQAASLTINAPTGTPKDGQSLLFRIKDNGTAQALSWNAVYVAYGLAKPTTTTINKTLLVMCIYNSSTSKWMTLSAIQEV